MVGGRLFMPQCTYREWKGVRGQPCVVCSLIPPGVDPGDGLLIVMFTLRSKTQHCISSSSEGGTGCEDAPGTPGLSQAVTWLQV